MSNNTVAGFRLSVQQERIWSQQAGDVGAFRAQCEVLLEGDLDVPRLQKGIRSVVARHEILRTAFHRQTGVKVPFQVILETDAFDWREIDLTELSPSDQAAQIRTLANEHGFDLEHGPALHAWLARLAEGRRTLLLTLPALCADLRSLQNLASEIARAYAEGTKAADEVMQYADLAEWQQELLASDDTKAGREFWRDYCRKLDYQSWDSLLSPFEVRRSDTFAPAVVVRDVDLTELPQDSRVQDFVLACWYLLLARMTGRSSITIGCEFDGRKYEELAGALGPVAKYMPLEAHVTGLTFNGLLEQIWRQRLEFRNWQESFSWSSADLPWPQDQSPLLPVVFDYVDMPPNDTHGGLQVATIRSELCAERFELKLSARRHGNRLALEFHYDSTALSHETVERWSNCSVTLLRAAAQNPETLVKRLPLLDNVERSRVLNAWNETSAEFPRHLCIHELFEAQAAGTPDRPAVRFQDEVLSYRQLNEQANQLAHMLQTNGVKPGSLVGLCIDRSVSMIVAVLSILKAGGAYVPLSADHPKARIAQQLSGSVALITEQKLLPSLPEFAGAVIVLDAQLQQLASEPTNNPAQRTTPEDPVYVIYTSGSTGVPKGVTVRHRNLVNYATFIQKRLELDKHREGLHFATVSTLAADLGNTCIYPSLLSGGCLHVIDHEVSADSHRLREYMSKYPVDVLKIVPSHLTALLNAGGGEDVLPRKWLITGGEALTVSLMEKVAATGANCEVLNHYGPTETTVGSLTMRVKEYNWKGSSGTTIPIGGPIANTRVYVIDAEGKPVPVGVAGELYIAGEGVTAGYINQPDRTAERFLPEPFGPKQGMMYRTGDLVRFLPNGLVEFLGRVDDQVKIRGFRIELGEIESVLLSHAGMKQAVVLAREDEPGEKRIVAYVVGTANIEALRSHLKDHLPDYMLPTAIVVLPRLPLNANGKVDRQALPKPEASSAKKAYLAPRTPAEEIVASIWSEVLKRDAVGVEDNFFEIGGHSLLATQIASRLREHFHIPVAVRLVFEQPTIGGLASWLDNARREEQGLVPPPITLVPRDQPLPLSYAQERLWVLDQLEPNNPLYNIPRSLRLRGPLQTASLERALNEVVRRHESQRTTFAVQDGRAVQIIHAELTVPLVMQDLSSLPEQEREAEARRLAEAESLRAFNLTAGPLVRATLLRLGTEDHVLLLTMHHIISDAWSAGIFFSELGSLYEAFCHNSSSPLPELTLHYADYAAHERDWLKGEVLDKQLAFWRERLKGAPPVIDLPLDHPRPNTRTFRGSCETFRIPLDILKPLKELARSENATLFMALMAGFQTLLSRYSGEEQIVAGTDLANRTTPETERMIGFFINLLAVRSDLSGNPTFREVLGRVRDGLLESYAHQEVPFPKIVQDLQPERSSTHNPIVQVLFVMQNVPQAGRKLGEVERSAFEVPVTTSKFDMAVFVAERPEELFGYWVYSTELFEPSSIQRMVRHFATLLQSAVSQPDTRLRDLAMLSPEEMAQQEAEKKQRKHSQLKALKATAPEGVGISEL